MKRALLPRLLPLALARFGNRYPWPVIALAIAACVLAVVMATRVDVETDILSLVPADNKVVQDYKTTVERFGSVDTLLVVIRLPPRADLEPVLRFAELLASELRHWELVNWVEYRLEDPVRAAEPLLDQATLFLTEPELEQLLTQLRPENLPAAATEVKARLMTPQGMLMKDLIAIDPAGLLPRLLGRVSFGGFGAPIDPDTGCLVNRDRTMLLMLAKPAGPAQDIRFDRKLAAGIEQRIASARAAWTNEGWEGEPPKVELTGSYIIALEDSKTIIHDGILNFVSSFIGVLLLFVLAFRRKAAPVFAFFPLLTGLALTTIFAALALRRFNSLTAAFGGMLIGLSIDYVILLYGRYIEERKAGADHEAAIETIGRHTAVGVLLGAVTTAATFYAFLITDFKGLSDLGLLTGTGILLLVLTVYLVLPALLSLLAARKSVESRLYLHSFGSDLLLRAVMRHPRITLTSTCALTVVLGVAALGLEFDDNIRNMRSADNTGDLLRTEVVQSFGHRFSPMTVRIDGTDDSEVLEAARQLSHRMERLVGGRQLSAIDTIADIIPPLDRQRRLLARLQAARPELVGLRSRFEAALTGAGLRPEAFAEGLGHLERALAVTRPLSLADLKGTTLEQAAARYVVHYEGGVSTAIYCYTPAGLWLRRAPPALVATVAAFPGAVLSGPNVVSAELRRVVWKDAGRAALLGLVAVFILLWLDFRTLSRAAIGLVPLLAGLCWMLGAMTLLRLQANLMNVFVITMIIGVGVDYGVHLLHRWLESDGETAALAETSKGITLAALTTMVGFGSLITSHYPGLRSMGAVACLGVLVTSLLSMTLLPALLLLLRRRRG